MYNQAEIEQMLAALPKEWRNLVRIVNKLNYGEVRITIQDGMPKMVEVAIKKIKLEDTDEVEDKIYTL